PNFQTIDLGAQDKYGQPIRIGGRFSNGNAVLPELADLVMNDPDIKLGIIRSLWHGTADHRLGQMYLNGWWRSPTLVEQYPSVASAMAYYFQGQGLGIPAVLIQGANGQRANSAGQSRCPTALQVSVGGAGNPVVRALQRPTDQDRYDRRKALLDRLNQRFGASRPDTMVRAMEKATEDAYSVT